MKLIEVQRQLTPIKKLNLEALFRNLIFIRYKFKSLKLLLILCIISSFEIIIGKNYFHLVFSLIIALTTRYIDNNLCYNLNKKKLYLTHKKLINLLFSNKAQNFL